MAEAEKVVAEALHAEDCGCSDGADPWYVSTARTAVAALRDAGLLLPEDAETTIQYGLVNGSGTYLEQESMMLARLAVEGAPAGAQIRMVQRTVTTGPWVPADRETE